MKYKIFYILTLISTSLFPQNADEFNYEPFLDSAIQMAKEGNKDNYKKNLIAFTNALEKNMITPENLPDKYFNKFTDVLFEGVLNNVIDNNFSHPYILPFLKIKFNKSNDDKSALIIGYLYYKAIGTNYNLENAIKWFKISSEKNNSYAQNYLGLIYKDEKNYIEAEKHFKKSIESKNKYAYTNLINLYMDTKNFSNLGLYSRKMKENLGFSSLEKAAEKGDRNAIVFLISANAMGIGYQINLDKAIYYLNKLSHEDLTIKNLFLGYINQERGSYDNAISYYKKFYDTNKNFSIVELISMNYLLDNKLSKSKKWAKKINTTASRAILFYIKCKNAMTVSDFDNCYKYKSSYKSLKVYYPFKEIEQEFNIIFNTNYQEKLPKN